MSTGRVSRWCVTGSGSWNRSLLLSSEAQTIVGMSKAASSRIGVLCGTMIIAGWLQIAIALRVDKELERGSVHGILQIVGEEVEPGEGK